jgi:hypothetical protein
MANVAETIYRLVSYVQMSIWIRFGVDSFNIYQAVSVSGPYTKFLEVRNIEDSEPRFAGRTVFSFNPSDLGWNNDQINYIRIAPVTGGIEGSQEGPVYIYPLHYDSARASGNPSTMFVWSTSDKRWIPASTSMSAFQ